MTRCPHPEWREIRRIYTPPPRNFSIPGGTGPEIPQLLREAMFGVTTIELRCEACLQFDHKVSIGNLTRHIPGAENRKQS